MKNLLKVLSWLFFVFGLFLITTENDIKVNYSYIPIIMLLVGYLSLFIKRDKTKENAMIKIGLYFSTFSVFLISILFFQPLYDIFLRSLFGGNEFSALFPILILVLSSVLSIIFIIIGFFQRTSQKV